MVNMIVFEKEFQGYENKFDDDHVYKMENIKVERLFDENFPRELLETLFSSSTPAE